MSTLTTSPSASPSADERATSTIPFWRGIGVIVSLELRQRVRGTGWYVLLGIFVCLVALVTIVLWVALGGYGRDAGNGNAVFSTILYFVLLLGTLVTPALSGNAINGDRDNGTLATTQVTLLSTAQIVLGKFLAAWIGALVFLAASVPFLVFAVFVGGLRFDTIVVSVLVLAIELGVVAAIGVGLSGILSRPLFSIVVTYLVVAALSIGSLIAFGLAGVATQVEVRTTSTDVDYRGEINPDTGMPEEIVCLPPQTYTSTMPRFDLYWPLLTLNPYVLVADAVPTGFTDQGDVQDLFGTIKLGLRSVQVPPEFDRVVDYCADLQAGRPYGEQEMRSAEEIIADGVPGWFVGLILHLALAIAALWGALARTKTPARTLPKGSRIA